MLTGQWAALLPNAVHPTHMPALTEYQAAKSSFRSTAATMSIGQLLLDVTAIIIIIIYNAFTYMLQMRKVVGSI